MSNQSNQVPPDVHAYLLQAATELIAEQGFVPLSQRDLELWLAARAELIGQRALDLQVAMFVKYLERQDVVAAVSESVYRQIRRRGL